MPRLPVTDLTSDAIKAFLGITGEVTLGDICDSDRVRGDYFDINYLTGIAEADYRLLLGLSGQEVPPTSIREAVRLIPHNISNFRNYGFDITGYSILAFSGEHHYNKILKYNNDEYWNDFYAAPIRDMRCAVRDPLGLLWIGGQVVFFPYTNERGLFSFNGSSWTRYTTPQITGEYVYAIELGTDPYMWIGTEYGFSIFDRTTYLFEHYYIGAGTVPSGKLGSNVITSFAYNSDDESMWIGTTNGLTHITDITDPSSWNLLKTTDGLPDNNIKCLMVGPDGDCWAGFDGHGMSRITESGGVYSFDNINTGSVPGIITNHVRKIAIDPDTYEVWAATDTGIQYFHWNIGYNDVTILRTADGLPSDEVYSVRRDFDNRKWFGFNDHIGMLVDIDDEIRIWGQWNGSDSLNIHEFLIDYEPQQVINEVVIGNQTWMSDNWRGNKRFMFSSGEKSKVYNYDEYNRENYGGLFTWRQIKEIGFCPTGWHVPSFAEWWEMIEYLGGITAAGDALKARSFGWLSHLPTVTNSTGFNAIGSGYSHPDFLLDYVKINEETQFWTSDENQTTPANGITIGFYYDHRDAYINSYEKDSYWFPVRLIKDTSTPVVTDYGMLYNWYVVNDTMIIDTPTSITATTISDIRIDLSWTNAATYDSIKIERSTNGADFTEIDSINGLDESYQDSTAIANTHYWYRIKGEYSGFYSEYSSEADDWTSVTLQVEARGDGSGVATLTIEVSSALELRLSGSARFYTDAAGTLGESTTTTVAATGNLVSKYIKCPSGTCDLQFMDANYLISFGHAIGFGSTNPVWGKSTGSYDANTPKLIATNWVFPNCVDIAIAYSAIVTFVADIAELSPNLERAVLSSSASFTGEISDIGRSCVLFYIGSANTISGNISDIPSVMEYLYLPASNTITGDIANIPLSMIRFEITGSNTIYGDIADLPQEGILTSFTVFGNNTISGAIADLDYVGISLTIFTVSGSNTISGAPSDIPSSITIFFLSGNNIFSGDIAGFPGTIDTLTIYGNSSSLTGDIADLPEGLISITFTGPNTILGNISGLPSTLTFISMAGSNTINGSVAGFSSNMRNISIQGNNTISGTVSAIPSGITNFTVGGLNTISGSLSDISNSITIFHVSGSNTIDEYTSGKTWSNSFTLSFICVPISPGGLDATEIDNLFIDLDTSWTTTRVQTIDMRGTNAAPTAASLTARNSLVAKGRTIYKN